MLINLKNTLLKKAICISIAFSFLLTGCSFNAGIDTLLIPPKLSEEQEQIYTALKNYVGTNISLKYPKTGDYLSAFITADIDKDGMDESIVFYEKNSINTDDNFLRINILDKISGKWKSVYDYAVEGTEIEKVMITPLGRNDRINIIVGYTLINQSEKMITIYDYENGKLNTTFENNSYAVFDAFDLDGDGNKELFTALNQSSSKKANAAVYKLDENGNYLETKVLLDEIYSDYTNVKYGILSDGSTGIYLDAVCGNSSVVTEILYLDKEGYLKRLISEPELLNRTSRPANYLCQDFNNDGKIEIPVPQIISEYKDSPEEEKLYTINWYNIEDNAMIKKYSSYYNLANNYMFIIPADWLLKFTIKYDSENDEIIFYQKEGPADKLEKELFRICSTSDQIKINELIESGYSLLHSRGDMMFLIYIQKNEQLIKSPAELMYNFIFMD